MDIIRRRIRDLRKEQGFKQLDVAKYLKLSNSGFSDIENGKNCLSIDYLSQLADLFNVSADYILGRTQFHTDYEKGEILNPLLEDIIKYGKLLNDEQLILLLNIMKGAFPVVEKKPRRTSINNLEHEIAKD